MNITKIILKRFIPHLLANINSFECDIVSNKLIIIGGNGSGKSSMISQLTPLPPVSSIYKSDGYKEIHLEHNGSKYICISDFSNKQRPHSFIKDDKELNISGNSLTQRELSVAEFDLNPNMNDLINFNINISSSTPKERETMLMKSHPSNIEYVVGLYKNVCKTSKGLKNNISMLIDRRTTLESELVDTESYNSLVHKYELYCDGITIINTMLAEINRVRGELPELERGTDVDLMEVSDIVATVDALISEHCNTYGVTDTFDVMQQSYVEKLRYLKREECRISEDLETVSSELNNVCTTISNKNIDGIESELAEILDELKLLKYDKTVPVVSDINEFSNTINKIHGMLDVLYGGHYISMKELNSISSKLVELMNSESVINETISNMSASLSKYKNMLEVEERLQPPSDCNMNCPLKTNKVNTIRSLKNDIKTILNDKTELCKRIDGIVSVKKDLKNKVECTDTNKEILIQLHNILRNSNWGKFILKSSSLIEVLNTNIYSITNTMKTILNNTIIKNRIDTLIKTKSELLKMLSTLKDASSKYSEEMGKHADKLKLKHESLINRHIKVMNSIKLYTKAHESVTDIITYVNMLKHNQELLQHSMEYKDNVNYKNVLDDLYSKLHKDLVNFTSIKDNLNKTIIDYKSVKDRLDNEVMVMLNKCEDTYSTVSLIEKMLSPKTGVPATYILHFLNDMIDQTNAIIKNVWGNDMRLKKCKLPLTYNIGIVFEGGEISDIKNCSTGQAEIINLAWIIAFYINLGLSDYILKLDEIDTALSNGNRTRLINLLNSLVDKNIIGQLVLINHHNSLYDSMKDAQIVCMNETDIILPTSYNENVIIE